MSMKAIVGAPGPSVRQTRYSFRWACGPLRVSASFDAAFSELLFHKTNLILRLSCCGSFTEYSWKYPDCKEGKEEGSKGMRIRRKEERRKKWENQKYGL